MWNDRQRWIISRILSKEDKILYEYLQRVGDYRYNNKIIGILMIMILLE